MARSDGLWGDIAEPTAYFMASTAEDHKRSERWRSERRHWPRVAYVREVVAYAGHRRLRCRSLDLGAGGIAVRAPFGAVPPRDLRLNIRLDPGHTVVVDGSVVRRKRGFDDRPIWNIRFDHVPRAIEARIAAYVDARVVGPRRAAL